MDLTVAAMTLLAGLLSGFADAVAGGGGLIMVSALMLGGLPAPAAIATSKLCGTTGALTSSVRFMRANLVDWPACVAIGGPVVLGAAAGSLLVSSLARAWADPLVIALLIAVTGWVLLRPWRGRRREGIASAPPAVPRARMLQSGALGLVFGFHDGFLGLGPGTVLLFGLLGLWTANFVHATGSAKVIALMANLAALCAFFWMGAVDLSRGAIAAGGTALGAYAGMSVVTSAGDRWLRPLCLAMAGLLVGALLVTHALR